MEGNKKSEGCRFDNNLKKHWFINKIEANASFFEKGYDEELIKHYIRDAFVAYSYYNLKPEQLLEVTVEINAKIQRKCNNRGE